MKIALIEFTIYIKALSIFCFYHMDLYKKTDFIINNFVI